MSWHFQIILIMLLIEHMLGLICSRYPANTFTPKSPVDDKFVISITGNPSSYELGHEYNISILAYNGPRFVGFSLTLENENGDSSYTNDLGHLEIADSVETRYSPICPNMVENTNTNSKTRVDVSWVAPSEPGSGCILLRAMVLQHRDVWYMDDGGLTKRICEEVVDDVESQRTLEERPPCCACDEARYELTFEGVWSRNLHPKNFPTKSWLTRFSDIVGAAHSWDYRFWEYGALATEGMREFAEHGSTRTLEREFGFNFKNGKIRTVIKARGPTYPNLNGQSIASVRVDPAHHMISLATKIEPSPDWIVGVSGLELCLPNCTWLEDKVINLYPWDIGTDAGPSYESPDQPQVPPDVIRRMRSDFPSDPRSPFFDETGAAMKPLATLTVRRQRLYERLCEDEQANNDEDIPRECSTHPWTAWTTCTAQCGEGRQSRTRVYKQPQLAKIYNCDGLIVLKEDRTCMGDKCGMGQDSAEFMEGAEPQPGAEMIPGARRRQAECELSNWGPWSSCNRTCGEGKRVRRRQYVNPNAEEKCQNARYMKLMQHKKCMGSSCLGELQNSSRNYGSREELEQEQYNPSYAAVEDAEEVAEEEVEKFNVNKVSMRQRERYSQPPRDRYQLGKNYANRPAAFSQDLEVGNLRKLSSETAIQPTHEHLRNLAPLRHTYAAAYSAETPVSRNVPAHHSFAPQQPFEFLTGATQSMVCNLPGYCLQPLQRFKCVPSHRRVNYWFYNYCAHECMLFTSDECDRNVNKFDSLELCESSCQHADNVNCVRQRQQPQQECQVMQSSNY